MINSDYGYGDEGRGAIPGGATMIFSIEFLDMWTPEQEQVEEEPALESSTEQAPQPTQEVQEEQHETIVSDQTDDKLIPIEED